MLISYPQQNWNSFASLQTLEAVLQYSFPKEAKEFDKLQPNEKEALASHAGLWIKTCRSLDLSSLEHNGHITIPEELVLAQVALFAGNIGRSPLEYDPTAKAVTMEKVGDIEIRYDASKRGGDFEINPLIYRLLEPFGCRKSGGFSQSHTGKA